MKPGLPNFVGKILLLLFSCTLFFTKSYSQAFIFGNEKIKFEAGVCFGPSFFLGDLGGNTGKGTNFLKDWNYETLTLSKGAYLTIYPVKWAGLRFQATMLDLKGDDALINTLGTDELWRKQRNLDFRTKVLEANLGAEIYPTMLFNTDPENEPRLRPYGVLSGGMFHFNPQGSLTDANGNKTWYYLHPLRTEGEGFSEYPESKPYNLTQFNLLYGGGLKYYVSDRVNVGMEVVYRKTFTDYIDDVSQKYVDYRYFPKYLPSSQASLAAKLADKAVGIIYPGMTRYPAGNQRGDLKDADSYFTAVLKIGFRLGPIYESSFARRAARQTRCPSVY
jgi:hypothetical protein